MTNLQISEEVLAAYLRGELNAAEAAAVEAWYAASAANRKLLGEVYYILYVNARINDTAGIEVERSLRQFKRRMLAGRRISLRRIAVRAAAAAAAAKTPRTYLLIPPTPVTTLCRQAAGQNATGCPADRSPGPRTAAAPAVRRSTQ